MGLEKLAIRKAKKQDLGETYKVIRKCAIFLESQGMDNWERYSIEKVLETILLNTRYVLTKNEEIIGTVEISETPPVFFDPNDRLSWEAPEEKAMYFTSLAVLPCFHGKGYGTFILSFAEEFTKSNNLRYLRMTMFSKNKDLRDYYLKRGFEFKQQRRVGEISLDLLFGEKRLEF